MKVSTRVILPLVVVAIIGIPATHAVAQNRLDSTWVMTFDHDFYNWATPHVDTFTFPPLTEQFSQVLLHYTIECPTAPGDCDPWDRLGYLKVLHQEPNMSVTEYEIAKFVEEDVVATEG